MLKVIGIIALIILVLVLAVGGYVWHVVHRGLPQVDGTIALRGLQAEVTVTRDSLGVPHIKAQNETDLAFAQGYVTAQDRLWQMDVLRRAAAGELSEIFGPATIAIDQRFRVLGFRQAAERDAQTAEPAFRAAGEAYARGVNEFIEQHQNSLPMEFSILSYRPRPWQPSDTLLIVGYMYETLTSSWRWDLSRARIAPKLGPERAAYFYDASSPYDHPIIGAASANSKTLATFPSPTEVINSSATQPLTEPQPSQTNSPSDAVFREAQTFFSQFGDEVRSGVGSNNWVVDGSHTASGKPLLANDTHLSLTMPDIWYTIQLAAPGYSAAGFALPGAPGVTIGHNDRIAWGFTNDGADVQDLYAEAFDPANPLNYKVHDAWQKADVRKEIIHIKGQPDRVMNVVVTRHGPIVERDHDTGYALKWTATEPGGLNHSYFNLAAARNWDEFLARMHDASGPAQNAVYADVDGHIGFVVAARIPIRNCKGLPPPDSAIPLFTPCGAIPFPGDSDDFEWQGYIPFEQLPRALDPPGGIIATANAQVAGSAYPHYVTSNWGPPWRTDRLFKLLSQPKKFAPKDFAEIQGDLVSEIDADIAQAIAKASSTVNPRDPRTGQLIGKLANWDGRTTADSVEATFAEQTVIDLERNLLRPYLGDVPGVNYPRIDVFLDRVLRERPAMWLPQEFRNFDELIIASADLAVADLTISLGQDTSKWTWGQRNALLIPHPITPLARWLDIGPMPQSGAHDVIKAAGHSFGPAMRFVADLSNWDNSFMEIVTGESGQYASEHYKDQFQSWYSAQPIPAPYSDAAVARGTQHTLQLVPQH